MKVVYDGKANTLTLSQRGFPDRVWSDVKTLINKTDEYRDNLPMEPTTTQAITVINQCIASNANGCCCDLLQSLNFIQIKNPRSSFDESPTIRINGHGFGANWYDEDSIIDITENIESYIRQTLPHVTFWRNSTIWLVQASDMEHGLERPHSIFSMR